MQRNFILTDVMKTGFDQDVKSFIESNTFQDQTMDITGQYYDLPQFDLVKYDRRFALIDFRAENAQISKNTEFNMEYLRRISRLKKLGFTFIQSSPWERKTAMMETTVPLPVRSVWLNWPMRGLMR